MAIRKTIVRTESLSTDRVHGYFDDDIVTCPICTNILSKPVTCKTCENSFCLKCIRLWLNEKPNSCPFNCHFQERKPPPILIKLLSKLKLNCQYNLNGCTILIPYEALEKHELHECLFRLTQCSNCSKEMLYNELEDHQNNDCLPKQLTCLICDTMYYQKEGHEYIDCLQKQVQIMDAASRSPGKKPLSQHPFAKRLRLLHAREQTNENYAQRIQSQNDIQDFTPSAPMYEPPSPQPSHSESMAAAASVRPSNETLRISTINFSKIPNAKKEGDHIPNGYAAFNWENIYYMFEEHVRNKSQLQGFINAYTNSRTCVAYNGRGNAMSIFLPNSRHTFGLHSFEAMSVYHDNFKLSITSYRSNDVFIVKNITLTKKPTLFEINWEQINKITFTPAKIYETNRPETFVLTCLNLVL
ncbi:unnamed protein product [Adineta steineri]|uniref:RING-type domain-containing protein n=3 Tax=Adineta steineri TaxID=433720 RepID=A0A815KAH8_9BILA|nr:unnamed protein product [Adineta steineri]CAF4034277.1 unnamed protein product [Adineta steineri]